MWQGGILHPGATTDSTWWADGEMPAQAVLAADPLPVRSEGRGFKSRPRKYNLIHSNLTRRHFLPLAHTESHLPATIRIGSTSRAIVIERELS